MITKATSPGYLYSVTTTTVCTVTDTDSGTFLCQAEDGAQGMFVAIGGSITCSDDTAVITQASAVNADINYQRVDELPAQGEEGIIYLLPKEDAQTDNVYEEWVWIDNAWEQLGPVTINLSDYPTLTGGNTYSGANTFTNNLLKTTSATLADNSVLNKEESDGLYAPLKSVKATGVATLSSGNYVAIGDAYTDTQTTESIAIGDVYMIHSSKVVALGVDLDVNHAKESTIIGYKHNMHPYGKVENSVIIGRNIHAYSNSVAIGDSVSVFGNYALALGTLSAARDTGTIALGWQSDALHDNSIAIGTDTLAASTNSIALGSSAQAEGIDAIAIGAEAKANSDSSLAIGAHAATIGRGSIALGFNNDQNNFAYPSGVSALYSLQIGETDNSFNLAMGISSFVTRDTEPLLTLTRSQYSTKDQITVSKKALYTALQNAIDYNYPAQPIELLNICDTTAVAALTTLQPNKIYKICNITGGVECTTLDFTNINFSDQVYPDDSIPTAELWITLTQGNAYTLVWPSAMLWPGDEAPYMQSPEANTDTTEQDAITYVITIRKNAVYINGTIATTLAGNLAYYFKNTVSL